MSARLLRPRPIHVRLRAGLVLGALGTLALGVLVPLLGPSVAQVFLQGGVTVLDVVMGAGLVVVAALAGVGLAFAGGEPRVGSLTWTLASATRAPRVTAFVFLAAAAGFAWAIGLSAGPLLAHGLMAVRWLVTVASVAGAAAILAVAHALPFGWDEVDAEEEGVRRTPTDGLPTVPLLEFLKTRTPYRGQIVQEAHLPARDLVARADEDASGVEERWPGLGDYLDLAGLKPPSRAQVEAAEAVLDAADGVLTGGPVAARPDGAVALSGYPGSGRTGALLAAAAWLVEVRGARVLLVRGDEDGALPPWFRALVAGDPAVPGRHLDVDGVAELPADAPSAIVADVRSFATGLLPRLAATQPSWLWGIRLVAALHPHRGSRAEWLHLRDALVRFRALHLARHQDVAMALVLPACANDAPFAEHLFCRTDTRFARLDRAAPAQVAVGWLPPTTLDPRDDRYLVRVPVDEEVARLLVSVAAAGRAGVLGGGSRRARVLVSDPTALFSPEGVSRLEETTGDLASEWAPSLGARAGDLVPEWTLVQGYAPERSGPAWDVVVHAGPGPTVGAEVESVRGLCGPGGVVFVVAAPRPHDLAAVDRLDALTEDPAIAVVPPGLTDALVTARWRAFVEGLLPGTVLERDRLPSIFDPGWDALVRELDAEGLTERVLVRAFARRHDTADVEVVDVIDVPRTWPLARQPELPWECVTDDRLAVRSTTAGVAERGDPASIDRDRLFYDWLPSARVVGRGHSLQVSAIRDGVVEVATPERDVAAEPVLYRPWRRLEATCPGDPDEVHRLEGDLEVRVRRCVAQGAETVQGVFRTGPGLNPDRRIVGEPVRVAPTSRTFKTAAVAVDLLHAALEEASARALLNAWRIEIEARYLRFDLEVDAELLPIPGGWRWLFFRRFPSTEPLDVVGELKPGGPAELRALLQRLGRRLTGCSCSDGCVLCAARLGDVPLGFLAPGRRGGEPPLRFDAEGDRVTRRGALDWLVAIGVAEAVELPEEADRSLARLERLRRDCIGDPPTWGGGWMQRLLGAWQRIPADSVAPIDWMTPEECAKPKAPAGYYASGPSIGVRIAPNPDDDWIREVILHEYTHNWQWESNAFSQDKHRHSPVAQRYYEGKIVIEGHATWAETQFRMAIGRGPAFRADDAALWTEYKAGFLLVDWIARNYGIPALYAWLAGRDDAAPEVRSSRLPWPIKLDDAVVRAGLADAVRRGGGPGDVL